jgi:DNA invertase Pin-like site-specific DNA recombinase
VTRPAIRAIRYVRVSSNAQADDKRYGYARQRIICTRSEAKHGLEVVGEVTDQISGAESVRPGLAGLPQLARERGATAISLSEVDRLSRDIPSGYAIISELISTKLDIYASNLQRRVNFRDVDSVKELNDALREAHLEKNRIRDRTYLGRLAKAADGLTLRPLNIYGYLDGQPFERQAAWVREGFEMSLDLGAVPVVESFKARSAPAPGNGLWTLDKLHAMLTNPAYKGEAGYGRELYCAACHEFRLGNHHDARRGSGICKRCGGVMALNRVTIPVPALVSAELYDAVQRARNTRTQFHGRRGHRNDLYALTGHLRCGVCGWAMSGTHSNGDRHYYRCSNGRRIGPGRCSHRLGYRVELVHEAVQRELQTFADRPGALEAALAASQDDPHKDQRALVETSRAELSARLGRIEDGYVSGVVSLERSLELRRETEAKLRALPTLTPVYRPRIDADTLRQNLRVALAERPLAETVAVARARVSIGVDGVVRVGIHE